MKIISSLAVLCALATLVLGVVSLSLNTLQSVDLISLTLLGIVLIVLYSVARITKKEPKTTLLVLAVLAFLAVYLISLVPEYLRGLNLNGIFHHSLITAVTMLVISIPAACITLYYALGVSPRAYDLSRYPIIVFPAAIILVLYGIIFYRIVVDGALNLDWNIITTPFAYQNWREEVWQDGWPIWVKRSLIQAGMLNHILGTFMLMGLTSLIALPIGMGVGIFTHEYASVRMAKIIKFCTSSLRAISGIIFAITAYILVKSSGDGFLAQIIKGFYYDVNGEKHLARGSFILAAIFMALLVIPLIARATEEGLNSLPREMYEGSLAVGASREHTLLNILIPWSIPNIITGLVLGCAEAAGSLTVLLFIGSTGEYGVGPLNGVTSLSYFIFECRYGREIGDMVPVIAGSYQYTAAFVLLVVTIGLTVGAIVLNKKLSRRYRGA